MGQTTFSHTDSLENKMGDNFLLYDKECPFCDAYIRMTKIKELGCNISLLDARDHLDLVEEFYKKELDINKGMILNFNNTIYFGSHAIYVLALLSTPNNFFNRVNKFVFQYKVLASLLYPILRVGRRATLYLLGKDTIKHF
jgi:predicted DCC family thiol-disulfide oxidoreductase YuxK